MQDDPSEPATVVMPDTDGRYQSLQVINQDHYGLTTHTRRRTPPRPASPPCEITNRAV